MCGRVHALATVHPVMPFLFRDIRFHPQKKVAAIVWKQCNDELSCYLPSTFEI
jgi:hypothetical protein